MTIGSDYSGMTREIAEDLASRGELVKIYLYPTMFNGSNTEEHTRYIPAWADEEKTKFDLMVKKRFDDGRIGAYLCTPTDHPGSVVPTTLKLSAFTRGMPIFVSEIEIWTPEN